ncbi:hypothetical protein EYC08_20435 [Tabrizicola sp. WMC-M-20]|nr:hypothetical protein EYC08_20435 [Tabrizicola sp. WMC-M-20]
MPKPELLSPVFETASVASESQEDGHRMVEAMLNAIPQPSLLLSADLHIEIANSAFLRTFLVDKMITEGCLIYELGNGQWDTLELRDLLDSVLPDNNSFYNCVIEQDVVNVGHRIMVLNARWVNHLQLILLLIEDQTTARRAEQALLDRELRLRRILDNTFAIVGLLTPEGIVIEANRAPLEAAGIAFADIKGQNFEDCAWWSYSSEVQRQLGSGPIDLAIAA